MNALPQGWWPFYIDIFYNWTFDGPLIRFQNKKHIGNFKFRSLPARALYHADQSARSLSWCITRVTTNRNTLMTNKAPKLSALSRTKHLYASNRPFKRLFYTLHTDIWLWWPGEWCIGWIFWLTTSCSVYILLSLLLSRTNWAVVWIYMQIYLTTLVNVFPLNWDFSMWRQ